MRRAVKHCVIQGGLDRVIVRQRPHPARQEEPQLLDRERVHDRFEQPRNILRLHHRAVHRQRLHAVIGPDAGANRVRLSLFRVLRIDDDHERLARLLHIRNGAGFRLAVILARDIRDRSVRRDDNADGAVVLHDLFGAKLRRLCHGKLLGGPGRRDHAGLAVLRVADRAGDHVAHRVDQPHLQCRFSVRADAGGLVRDEFRLRRHDRPARAGLRQLVGGAFALIDVFDVRQHELLHEALDKGGFSRPHRADDADIDRAVRAVRDLRVDRTLFHIPASRLTWGSAAAVRRPPPAASDDWPAGSTAPSSGTAAQGPRARRFRSCAG